MERLQKKAREAVSYNRACARKNKLHNKEETPSILKNLSILQNWRARGELNSGPPAPQIRNRNVRWVSSHLKWLRWNPRLAP